LSIGVFIIISMAANRIPVKGSGIQFLETLYPGGGGDAQRRSVAPNQVLVPDAGYHGAIVTAEFRGRENTAEIPALRKPGLKPGIGRHPASGDNSSKAGILGSPEQTTEEDLHSGLLK
jgi:hypothetical protein